MILSDYDLHALIKSGRLKIEPFDETIIRENGLDLRLDDEIAVHNEKLGKDFILDPASEEDIKKSYVIKKADPKLIVPAHSQVLLTTHEYVKLPDSVVGFVELRSTWARHGLSMPPTIIDAGFEGNVTLEVFNGAPYAIALAPKIRFAHVVFVKTLNRVENAYKGTYSGQRGIKLPKVLK